jgi:hypothetical protein
VASKKDRQAIAAGDVLHKFDNATIERLAITYLPKKADRQRLADGVREAVRIYAEDARMPSANAVDDEIAKLHRAASRRDHEQVALLIDAMSPEVRQRFETREATPGFQNAGLKFPSSEASRDPARRDRACEVVRQFCRMGYGPRGKPLLYVASERIRRPARREAERRFVMNLRLVWLEATGTQPRPTVNPGSPDRPFANFARECLILVGASHADAVGLINDLRKRWREMQRLTGRANVSIASKAGGAPR